MESAFLVAASVRMLCMQPSSGSPPIAFANSAAGLFDVILDETKRMIAKTRRREQNWTNAVQDSTDVLGVACHNSCMMQPPMASSEANCPTLPS